MRITVREERRNTHFYRNNAQLITFIFVKIFSHNAVNLVPCEMFNSTLHIKIQSKPIKPGI